MSYLGIDFGTSGLRGLLVDADGVPLVSAEAHYPVASPHPGWSEQAPADWITALDSVMAELSAQPDFATLRGIAVAGHMHGAVVLDSAGEVLRPCILWNDTRSHAEAARLDADPAFREISGNIVFPGFTAPKLDWLKAHEPEIYAKVATVLLPAAYLNLYLTGDAVGDISDASGTSWLDMRAREWSDDLLGKTGLASNAMPRLVEGSAPAGALRAELRRKWGLTGDVVVAGGAADNAAAACGMGVIAAGQGFVSLGTSGVVLAAQDSFAPRADLAVHSFCHAVPERWYQMGVMLAATDSLNWLAKITGAAPADLTAALGPDLAAPSDPMFLPYLSGERTPYNDAHIRAGFAGLSMASSREALTQSVLEGVSFGLRDCLDAIDAAGRAPKQLYAIGGGAASDLWLRLLATVLQKPLLRPTSGAFGAALGAARLAICAQTGQSPDAVMTTPDSVMQFDPDAALSEAYQDKYLAFKSAYAPMRALSLGET